VAVQRMKIIKFYEKHGESAAKEAFGADRKVVSRWRKRLTESGGKLTSLIPRSTRPRSVRQPQVRVEIVNFIKEKREKRKTLQNWEREIKGNARQVLQGKRH
jgi:transposase